MLKIKYLSEIKSILLPTILFVGIMFLTNCRTINSNCPSIATYSNEEQIELARLMKELNSITLNKFILDYYNLRNDLRICNENK